MQAVEATAGQSTTPGRWPAPVLAALPHLLLALSFMLSAGGLGGGPTGGLSLLALAAAALVAWRGRWPLWSGSWAGYWLLVPVLLPAAPLASAPPWLQYLPMALTLPALFLLFRWQPLYGLLALQPFLVFPRLFDLELVVAANLVWAGVYVLLGLTAATIVWAGSVRLAVWLAVGVQLLLGLAFAGGRLLLPYHAPPGMAPMAPRALPDAADWLAALAPSTLAAVALVLGWLIVSRVGFLAHGRGRPGQSGYLLLLLALALLLAGNRTRGEAALLLPPAVDHPLFTSVTLAAGLLLALAGLLHWGRAGTLTGRTVLLYLLALFTPFVIFTLPPPLPLDGRYSALLHGELLLGYAGVLLWIGLALMALSRVPGKDAIDETT